MLSLEMFSCSLGLGSLEAKGSFELLFKEILASWVLGREELVNVGPIESLFLAVELVGVLEAVLFCLRRSWIYLSILIEICFN